MTTETPKIIDALPYIDTAIDDDEEQRAISMKEVDDEMYLFPPEKDYLEYLPPVKRTFSTPLIEDEHNCLDRNEPRPDSSELAKIQTRIPPPASSMMDDQELEIWSECMNQIKIKLEYNQRQMVNLELLKSYGLATWEQYITSNEAIESALEAELRDLERRTQEVNWKRKSEQEHISKNLQVLKNEWNLLVEKNRILADEMRKLRSQVRFDEQTR